MPPGRFRPIWRFQLKFLIACGCDTIHVVFAADIEAIVAAVQAFAGVSVEQFHAEVKSYGALPTSILG